MSGTLAVGGSISLDAGTGAVAASTFSGSGAGLSSLPAANLVGGPVPDGVIDSLVTRDGEVFGLVLAADGSGAVVATVRSPTWGRPTRGGSRS